jgi:hypothetical protein
MAKISLPRPDAAGVKDLTCLRNASISEREDRPAATSPLALLAGALGSGI